MKTKHWKTRATSLLMIWLRFVDGISANQESAAAITSLKRRGLVIQELTFKKTARWPNRIR
jgi:hypothetical protein